jgi:hypothetical protein
MRKLALTFALVIVSLVSFAQDSQVKTLCEFENGNRFVLTISFYEDSEYLTYDGGKDSKFTKRIVNFTAKDQLYTFKVKSGKGHIIYYINRDTERFSVELTEDGDTFHGNIISVDKSI